MDDSAFWEMLFIYVVGVFVTFGAILKFYSLGAAIFFAAFWPFYLLAMFGQFLSGGI